MQQALAFGPSEPWDMQSAETLTRLYESEEGNLCRPAAVRRTPASPPRTPNAATEAADGTADRTWLEAHISLLTERLQDALGRCNPEASLAALNARLDAIEQRFSAALGRVARRADLDDLKSIESHVLMLAANLERARERLEQIGNVDDLAQGLEGRLDEAGARRAAALEKLLHDCIAEWRDSEQRTAGAVHNLEEVVNRLGDSIDTMEAWKPAPDLAVATLIAPEPGEGTASFAPMHGSSGRPPATHFYHSMLDAADYAPTPAEPLDRAALAAAGQEEEALPADAVEWPSKPTYAVHARAGKLTPATLRIMAVRAKLRQSAPSNREPDGPRDAVKRASLSLLLMAGAAFLAGGTYLLYQTFIAPAPLGSPVMIELHTQPTGAKSDVADPGVRRVRGAGAS